MNGETSGMHIPDADLVELVALRDGGLLLIDLKHALKDRFAESTWEQREEAIASALLRRVLVFTPMGHIRSGLSTGTQ